MRCTPANAAASDRGSPRSARTTLVDAGDARASADAGHRAHVDTAVDRARARPRRRAHRSHRSRAPSRRQSLADTVTCVRVPRPGPGIGHELTVPQELACALRILAREGWRENLSGHITWADRRRRHVVQPVGHLVGRGAGLRHPAPRRRRRDRRRASGTSRPPSSCTPSCTAPAPTRRSSCTTIPYYATLLAAMGEMPRMVHQNSCIFDGELAFVDEYGGVDDADAGQVARGAGRRRERDPARAPRRDRDRRDDRRGVLQGGHVRAHVPLHLRHPRGRPRRPTRSPPSTRAELKAAAAAEHAARLLGRRGAPAARATNPRSHEARRDPRPGRGRTGDEAGGRSRMNMSLDDLASNEAFGGGKGRREQITWLPEPEPRERVVHRHLGRRPRRRAARRVHRPLPEEVRRRGAARRRHRRRRRGVDVAGPGAPERRVQRGRRPAVDASTASSRRASTRCAAARGTSTRASPTWTSTACRRRCASRRSCPASSVSGSRCGPTTTSSRSPRCARTTTGTSTRGAARIPIASSRTRSRSCAIPRSRRDEIRAQRGSAASRR